MKIELIFMMRLAVAGLLGAAIGLEREYRAKDAGARTHFLVAVGSALMMIVSQWGFQEFLSAASGLLTCEVKLDPSRVAAQVVSGIGFIGAGTIIMQKQFVRGLTTAAGLWAVAGIGLAVGAGMYMIAVAATVLTLFCLELLQILTSRIKMRCVHVVFFTTDPGSLINITDELHKNDYTISSFSVSSTPDMQGRTKVSMYIREHHSLGKESDLFSFFARFQSITVEKMEQA